MTMRPALNGKHCVMLAGGVENCSSLFSVPFSSLRVEMGCSGKGLSFPKDVRVLCKAALHSEPVSLKPEAILVTRFKNGPGVTL